jgi:hypothetical protein
VIDNNTRIIWLNWQIQSLKKSKKEKLPGTTDSMAGCSSSYRVQKGRPFVGLECGPLVWLQMEQYFPAYWWQESNPWSWDIWMNQLLTGWNKERGGQNYMAPEMSAEPAGRSPCAAVGVLPCSISAVKMSVI